MIDRVMRLGAVRLGLLAAIAATAIWILLALVSGLIFHLMPAAPPLVGAWVYRLAGGRRLFREAVLLAGAGIGLSLLGIGLLAAAARPLDDGWFTVLTQVAGAGLAVGLAGPFRLHRPIGG